MNDVSETYIIILKINESVWDSKENNGSKLKSTNSYASYYFIILLHQNNFEHSNKFSAIFIHTIERQIKWFCSFFKKFSDAIRKKHCYI